MLRKSVTGLLLICAGSAHGTDFYRWVDKTGSVHYSDQAPSGHVNKLEQRKLNPNVIEGQGSYLMKNAASKNPVTLFGGDCGPVCSNAKALLDKRGIPYALKDPQKNKADADALNALTGKMELPVLQIGTSTLKGFEPTRWNAMLDEAGYPKSSMPGTRKRETSSSGQIRQ